MKQTILLLTTLALASIGPKTLATNQNPAYFFTESQVELPRITNTGALYAGYEINYEADKIASGSYPILSVWPGSGLTLNFTKLNESVKQVWLDDPSKLVLDYAGELCNLPCRGGVTVLHLKRVQGLEFENLPSTPSTTLTVVTVSPQGEKIYKFRLTYGKGSAKYLTVTLNPTEYRPSPSLDEGYLAVARPNPKNIDTERIEVFEQGLATAKKELEDTSRNRLIFTRVELFIADLRQGYSEADARERNHLSKNAVNSLIEMGKPTKEEADERATTEL
ncbi:hypothetical protein CY0110_31915 [Crocosphaera chwakensis CCY0110]|uniref:Uncharacterized protein n=1 Tax=Crocosphaera chwakensis CCY0110 TaxID=391612 RepID=A3IXA8_9CHRO|nr:hypothetical protein CY0110_31915 [Crocosphaera chwakensis CCY0110]